MERASTAALPAYTPSDARDLHVALTEIDRQLNVRYSRRMGARMLMGYSIGAFESLFIAANTDANDDLIQFDRFVAIDTPVRLLYAVGSWMDFMRRRSPAGAGADSEAREHVSESSGAGQKHSGRTSGADFTSV